MADRSRTPPVPTSPPLVGRDRELATLRAALDAALAGRGSLVLIGGDAGIGKTALAEALLDEAQARGALVLVGRCYDLEETPPYGPWVELFGRYRPDPGGPPHPRAFAQRGTVGTGDSRAALVAEVRDWFAALAARRPPVILLEDLHWADPDSFGLLRQVARDLADLPILILATYRDDEIADESPLAAAHPALVREARAARLAPARLTADEARAFVRARYPLPEADEARLAARLHAHAEGNPLYLGELLRALEEEGVLRSTPGEGRWALGDLTAVRVPPLLRQIIGGRAARLGPGTARLLGVAAVLGQAVPLDLWAAVGEADDEALADAVGRAVAARVLAESPDGAGVRFAHALVREALYEAIPLPRRRALHRRAADALLATRSPDPDAVASHLQRAGDPRALEWLVRAGVRARRADAWLTAIDRFLGAAHLLEGEPGRARERGWLLYYGGLLSRFSDNDRALALLDEAEQAALVSGDRVLLAYTHYQRGPSRCMHGEVRLGLVDIERGVAELEALPGEYHRRSNDALALATIEGFLPETAEQAPAPPGAAGAPPTATPERGVLINWLGHAGRYRDALAAGAGYVAAMAAALGEDHARQSGGISAHLGIGHAHAALGQPADARREYQRARRRLAAMGDWFMVEYTCWVELLMVVLPYEADRVGERTALLGEAQRAWGRAGGASTTATHASLADLFVAPLEGRWAEARRLAEAGRSAPTINQFQGAISALAALAREQGDVGVAWDQVRKLHPAGPATAPGDCYFPHGIATQVVAAALALDAHDLTLAGRWLDAHGRWLEWSGALAGRSTHRLLRARHARLSGDAALAGEQATRALTLATDPRQPLALLAARRALGELAGDAGDSVAAIDHLRRALVLADACAAPYERALTLLGLAEVSLVAGARDDARAALDEARAICAPLGARPAQARAEALAARLGAPDPAPEARAALPFRLTAREAEVLRLLAEGLGDAQIAARLYVSRNTVATHIKAVYGKLGVASRAAATRVALERGLA